MNELEMLPAAFDHTLNIAELIARKQADPNGRRQSLTNFLWFQMPDLVSAIQTQP